MRPRPPPNPIHLPRPCPHWNATPPAAAAASGKIAYDASRGAGRSKNLGKPRQRAGIRRMKVVLQALKNMARRLAAKVVPDPLVGFFASEQKFREPLQLQNASFQRRFPLIQGPLVATCCLFSTLFAILHLAKSPPFAH